MAMSIGFKLKSPTALMLHKRVSMCFEALKPGIDFMSLVMKDLDDIFQYKVVLSTMKMCLFFFNVATFINYLRWIFRINYYHFYISTWCFTLHLMLWWWLLSYTSCTSLCYLQTSPSAASLLLWVLNEYKRVQTCSDLGLGLRECCG